MTLKTITIIKKLFTRITFNTWSCGHHAWWLSHTSIAFSWTFM